VKHLSCAPLKVGSWPYPQTQFYAGKACQGQTHWLITKISKLRSKSFIAVAPGLARTNTSFLRKFVNYKQKSFKTLAQGLARTNTLAYLSEVLVAGKKVL
jgi:hypothetical protein